MISKCTTGCATSTPFRSLALLAMVLCDDRNSAGNSSAASCAITGFPERSAQPVRASFRSPRLGDRPAPALLACSYFSRRSVSGEHREEGLEGQMRIALGVLLQRPYLDNSVRD